MHTKKGNNVYLIPYWVAKIIWEKKVIYFGYYSSYCVVYQGEKQRISPLLLSLAKIIRSKKFFILGVEKNGTFRNEKNK